MMANLRIGLFLLGAGCAEPQPAPQPLWVFAASSLTEGMQALEADFEEKHPEVDVRTVFGGSQILRLQIAEGARADVYASADPRHVAALAQAGHVAPGQPLAHNELVLITPAASDRIQRFEQLGEARRLVIGTEEVPIGRYTRQMLARVEQQMSPELARRIWSRVVSEESNVRLVRAKVELGEADAAIVYRSDARDPSRLRVISLPPNIQVPARYEISPVLGDRRELADRFIRYSRSPAGQEQLASQGLQPVAP